MANPTGNSNGSNNPSSNGNGGNNSGNSGGGGILGDIANALNPFSWFDNGVKVAFDQLAGDLASGIESGFLAIIKDIWDVILGPIEVILGVVIFIAALVLAMKNDLIAIAGMAKGFAA